MGTYSPSHMCYFLFISYRIYYHLEQTSYVITFNHGVFMVLIERNYKQLLDKMELADSKYWIDHSPIISDGDYDALVQEIQNIEKQHPELVDESRSPTHNFDSKSTSGSVVHTQRMYSLDKSYTSDKLRKWYDRIIKIYPLASFFIDPKLDGMAIDVWYRDYKLAKILTRGTNGIAGEDITHQAPLFHTLSKTLPPHPYLKNIDIRGEAVLYDMTFKHHIQETYPNTYSNSRSAVAGLLMGKSLPEKSIDRVSFKAYNVVFQKPHPYISHLELQLFLRDVCGFVVPSGFTALKATDVSVPYEKIWEQVQDIETHRERAMCGIDGVVIRLNSLSEFDSLGYTDHHPIGAVAYKFPPKGMNTILTDIVYQVTRTGKLSPIGIIEPIQVDGVTITNVNLHNESHIKKIGVQIGDMVHVVRQGDVVPMISSVIVERRVFLQTRPHVPPTHCISCNQPLVQPNKSDYMYCVNSNCPAIFLENISYFTSKHGMNVKGIGDVIWKQLISLKRIRSYKDIFTLNLTDLQYTLGENNDSSTGNDIRYSTKTCEKFYRTIQQAWKNLTLAACLTGLGIPRIGRGVALHISKLYTDHVEFIDALSKDRPKQLSVLEWKALQDYFEVPSNRELILYIFNNKPQ